MAAHWDTGEHIRTQSRYRVCRQACKPAGARAGAAAGQSKVAAYEWEVAQRCEITCAHLQSLTTPHEGP
jgi:hypothetical protein